jgi:hypothetical protein
VAAEIGDIRRVEVRPGDRLVVRLDCPVDDAEFDMLLARLREAFGPGVPILLLEPGIDITVIGRPEADGP